MSRTNAGTGTTQAGWDGVHDTQEASGEGIEQMSATSKANAELESAKGVLKMQMKGVTNAVAMVT